MLQIFSTAGGRLKPERDARDKLASATWIDLADPTPEEKALVQQATGIAVEAPDPVTRFYIDEQVRQVDGRLVLKALLLGPLGQRRPTLVPVTMIRAPGRLVTVSCGSPDGLSWLAAEGPEGVAADASDLFPAVLDMVIDNATDVLEKVAADIERLNRVVLQHHATAQRRRLLSASRARRMHQIEATLTELGYCREVLGKLRRSVLSFRRLVGLLRERVNEESLRRALASFEHDLSAIAEAQVDLANGVTFMLDGAVGYITILQSKTINIMTILGVLLTPPVLVASIYGMNFKHMPELEWGFGYAWALALMVVSAAGMYLFMRTRNWL